MAIAMRDAETEGGALDDAVEAADAEEFRFDFVIRSSLYRDHSNNGYLHNVHNLRASRHLCVNSAGVGETRNV